MNDKMLLYSMKLAEDARKRCEEKRILDRQKLILELNDMKKILKFFGANLLESEKLNHCFIKIKNDKYDYIVYYKSNKLEKMDKIKLLTGLGEMFLDKEKTINKIYHIDDSSLYSETFARAFAMPENLFLKECINNLYSGKINVTNIANSFEVDILDAIARGYELKIFK